MAVRNSGAGNFGTAATMKNGDIVNYWCHTAESRDKEFRKFQGFCRSKKSDFEFISKIER